MLRVSWSWRRLFARSFSSSAAYDATRAKFYLLELPTAAAFETPGFEASSRSLLQRLIQLLLPALLAGFSAPCALQRVRKGHRAHAQVMCRAQFIVRKERGKRMATIARGPAVKTQLHREKRRALRTPRTP